MSGNGRERSGGATALGAIAPNGRIAARELRMKKLDCAKAGAHIYLENHAANQDLIVSR